MAKASASYTPYHDSAGKQTNPDTTTVLADTGEMPAGLYEVRVLPGASVAATMLVQHRNAANGGNVSDSVLLRLGANLTNQYVLKYSINTNERIRVLPEATITGTAEATLQAVRVL